ncbi:hypothetical protein PRIPAC_92061 [Pristionchus pacificus]|uniref:ShK domain-containing protein n=1 Tax=Pristionchus pacificus TaxID=54126 RepID=A0A2A6CDE2_PRIPA|nr:hypothetical protein PRIPAC_92061 [Pristionchus pacificus]|eukprot:PDM76110.1 ShK domain-containing protein [Pristionchus pacificus]
MNVFIIISTVLAVLIAQVDAQCTTQKENANCAKWKATGFCTNTAMSLAQRQLFCGVSCGLCTAAGVPIATTASPSSTTCTADGNKHCAKWASKGFCTQTTVKAEVKTRFCCKTCGSASGSTTTAATTTTV